jgi:hypothetical protein
MPPLCTLIRIERGNLYRPMGITDDDAWDLITRLVKVKPSERFGSNCQVSDASDPHSEMKPVPGDLSVIKQHPFFTRGREVNHVISASTYGGELRMDIGKLHQHPALRVPSLKDLSSRACADMVCGTTEDR